MDKISFFIDKCRCCLKDADEANACEVDEFITNQITFVTAMEVSKND